MPPNATVPAEPKPRTPGRPRNESTRSQILAATMRLLEEQTVQAITIEAIAREAGAGKATIYRWWPSKALVVIDAFMEHHVGRTPMRRDLPPADAIAHHIAALTEQYAGWSGRIVAQIIAEGQADAEVLREFRQRFHYGRRAVVQEVLNEWLRTGALDPATNLEALADLLYAPIYMRLLLGHAPLDQGFARQHVAYMYGLLGVTPPTLEHPCNPLAATGSSGPKRRGASSK